MALLSIRSDAWRSSDAGFSLVEVLIAVGLLSAVALGIAQLFAASVNSNLAAKSQTSGNVLAAQKMEQLRGLTWGFDSSTSALGLPVSDATTNLSTDPPSAGGSGLNPSPSGTLDQNAAGYCDYLDVNGKWIGNGTSPPEGTVYIRRWSVEPLPTNPNNTLILQVLVTTLRRETRRGTSTGSGVHQRSLDDAWLVSVKTRKAQ